MLVLAILAGLTIIMLGYAAYTMLPADATEKRLKALSDDQPAAAEIAEPESISELDDDVDLAGRRLLKFISSLGGFGESGKDGTVYGTVRQRLSEAGYRRRSAVSIYNGSRMALGGILPVILILGFVSTRNTPPILFIAMMALLGYLVPGMVVDRVRAKRLEDIRRGLSNAIDLMVVCVQAGLGLGTTFGRVATEFADQSPVLSAEFMAAAAETQAGRSLVDSLRSLSERCGSEELNLLTSLLIQSDRFGTPVVTPLQIQAEAMRTNQMLNAEEQAQKAPVKMMMPAGLIFFSIILVLGGPASILLLKMVADTQ
ncbi:MAG: type II secretion system F family protein [Deltaproteobacteria bacterium]|nr:type II secretion system F family protein [Deltaproteobacteria bacterium]